LGVGLDTLTLTATILTVAVFDDDVFDELFGGAVQINFSARRPRRPPSPRASRSQPRPFAGYCATSRWRRRELASSIGRGTFGR